MFICRVLLIIKNIYAYLVSPIGVSLSAPSWYLCDWHCHYGHGLQDTNTFHMNKSSPLFFISIIIITITL